MAKQPQEIDEEVDEVEIEGECAKECILLGAFARIRGHEEHLFYLLRVVGSEPHEDDDAGVADDKFKHGTVNEDIDHRGDDEADKGHKQDFAP